MNSSAQDIENLISKGRYFEARIKAEAALKHCDDLRYKQLLALALSKLGLPEHARKILEPIYTLNEHDSETAGILGSIYKSLFRKNQDTDLAIKAYSTYKNNFSSTRNYYTGINAASMSVISGHGKIGRELATEVIDLLPPSSEEFWHQVTLGEAWLISRETKKATDHYLEARKLAGKEWGKVQSTHDQLKLLSYFIPVPSEILHAFAPPGIIAFIGHMIDHPSRTNQRFPASIEKQVKQGIVSAIRTLRANIGYCSLSCGSDILFAESMLEEEGEVNIFLPFNREDFLNASVKHAGDEWLKRFEQIENSNRIHYVTNEQYCHNTDLFSFQSRIVLGSAVLRAALNFTTPSLLTVLSETDLQQNDGGTRDTLNQWPFSERHINVNPDNFVPHHLGAEIVEKSIQSTQSTSRHVLYCLLVDLPGASNFEKQNLIKSLNGTVNSLLLKPEIFDASGEIIVAFHFANSTMEIMKEIAETKKFGRASSLRISLHVGVFDLGAEIQNNEEWIQLKELHRLAPPGIISAYGWFAAATILDSENWSVDFASSIGKEKSGFANEVYNVQFLK